jgi:hypothetical protein
MPDPRAVRPPEGTRPWTATCRFPGLCSFHFGTAWTARTEGEEAARVAITKKLREVFPTPPEIVFLLPGQMVFVPDE